MQYKYFCKKKDDAEIFILAYVINGYIISVM